MSVKVMSQNAMCWGVEGVSALEMRRPLMKKAVLESGADVIGFQEVTPVWTEFFKEDLKGFDSFTVYRGRDSLEGTPIYWKTDRLELLERGHFWLSETPDREGLGWDAVCVRITCWAVFRTKDNNTFAFVNTHLDHVGNTARINGIKQICRFVKDKFGSEMPLVLTGDFNDFPDSDVIRTANELLVDARAAASVTTDETTFHGFKNINKTIDYIYISDNIHCSNFEVIKKERNGCFQSDHHGIAAELEI